MEITSSSFFFLFLTLFLPCVATSSSLEDYDTDVLILGAGMSGIAAAEILHNEGIKDFIIIEGKDRIGGRMRSMKYHGTTIELGANWIQGIKNNPIAALAKKYGLKGNIEDGSFIIRNSTGGDTTIKANQLLYGKATGKMEEIKKKRRENKQEDIPWRVGYELSGWRPKCPEETVYEYYMADFEYAVPSKYISLRTYMDTDSAINDTAKQMFITDQRGFAYLVQEIASGFLTKNDARLKLKTRVKSITYNENGVLVVTDNGRNFTAKRALVTFSIGVLKSGAVRFSPDLPDWKLEVIFRLNMVLYTKIFVKFPYKFWDDYEYIFFASKRRGFYPIWQDLEADSRLPKGTNILLITVTQQEAQRLEFQDDKVTQAEIMKVLRKVYGNKIPEMIDLFAPKWQLDEMFLGSWANVPLGMSSNDYASLQKNVQTVYFAGEATHELYNGFVHGAYFTGRDRAHDIVRSLRKLMLPESLPYFSSELWTA